MLPSDFRRMLTHSMMAFGKQRDRIDVTAPQHFLKLFGVEFLADRGNFFGGVEVEMNLAKAHES